ncbi:MAG: hypothetical protein OCC49_14130 [Fibrobacterales bacterium]
MCTQFEMMCDTCGLESTVAGGEFLGNSGKKFITMYCHECNTLEDIYVGEVWDEPLILKEKRANGGSLIDKCPCCHGDSLTLWTEGEACPCCGGDIELTGRVYEYTA